MSREMQIVFKGNTLFGDDNYKQYFKRFIDGIPNMMKQLRVQVNSEITEPYLVKRIPTPLLAALKQIN